MAMKIQLRRDTASNWTSVNPILGQGEPGYELDTGKIKYGDGVNYWSALSYNTSTAGTTGPAGPAGPAGSDATVTSTSIATALGYTPADAAAVPSSITETVYTYGNSSTSVTPNRNNGTIQKITANGNFTLNAPTNMAAGQSLTLIITQDATGNRTMSASAAYKFATGYKTLSTAASSIDMINMFYDGTTYYATLTSEYA